MPKLTENTVVKHPETGEPTLLAATGDLPDWAVDLVGDHLLDGKPTRPARVKTAEDGEVARLKARIAELEQAQGGSQPPAGATSEPKAPPRRGSGSGAPEWRLYAAQQGVDVPEDASRDDVIAALEAAGKPVN